MLPDLLPHDQQNHTKLLYMKYALPKARNLQYNPVLCGAENLVTADRMPE